MTNETLTAAPLALPEGFTPVTEAVPNHNGPVLVIRKAAFISATFEVMTAFYDVDYRPLSPWLDTFNDCVTDSGKDVLGWREMPEWFGPERPPLYNRSHATAP